jgi:Cu-Zn family superoxide dismutase
VVKHAALLYFFNYVFYLVMKGVATFSGAGGVKGEAVFTDTRRGLEIMATFSELPSGEHGFHIHTNGDLREEGCMGACAHYNKGPKRNHGPAPGTQGGQGERHTGDLGNIEKTDHVYRYKLVDVTVADLLGRTLIVHADPDDLGLGGHDDSLVTGHSGKRIACAIIGRAKDCVSAKSRTRKLRR